MRTTEGSRVKAQVRARAARALVGTLASTLLFAAFGAAAFAAPADQSVAYQLGPSHSGHMADAGLASPLAEQWSVTLPAAISYPLIVNGRVYVTTAENTLYARSQATGAGLWSRAVGGSRPWSGLAYDAGQVFVLNHDGLVSAVDPVSGSLNWNRQLPAGSFNSPPTAVGGIVYAGGGGSLFALRAGDGRILWRQPVNHGDASSPAVDATGVYVGYACQQVHGFHRITGAPLWHNAGPCAGGGGRTPIVAGGRVFAREAALGGNIVLSAATGAVLGPFNAEPSPAIANGVMYTLDGTILRSVADSGLGVNGWQFTGDGGLTSAPLVAGGLVFAGSSTGALYALDAATGVSSWSANVGASIPAPDEQNVSQPLTGLGAANGTLVVPAGARLVAYRTAGAITLAPANTAAPTIDGRPQVGSRLAADVGIWSRLPTAYSYLWQRCDGAGASCVTVAGATGATFTPAPGDAGATLRVQVTATNAIGASGPVTSGPSAVVMIAAPVSQVAPSISGTAAVGETLTASPGTWSGSPASFAYQWMRCHEVPGLPCGDIPGATAATYEPTRAEAGAGAQLVVRVIATNAGGDSDPVTSAPTATIPPAAPVNTDIPPDFDGFLQQGELLTASVGTWEGNPTSFRYQWYSCDPDGLACPDIAGATQQTYVIGAAQVGRYIGVDVIGVNAGGESEPASSDAFGPVLVGYPRIATLPTVNGTPREGQTLTADQGSWSPAAASYSFQWYGCDAAVTTCDLIDGATAPAYPLGPADVGRRYGVGVIASNQGGTSDEEFSELTEPVLRLPTANPPPPPPVVAPPPPNNTFVTLRKRARADGKLEFSVQAPGGAGRYTARATASARLLARG
ncbi:MAG TPA: PQQ-binding-like beta-propeller repeat protein, partial [Solirubrobacteraceae bacterium]|nr:PQQ-binding-like beta-propeller repeat protein [Solirubrobacteraceae bacterium]